MTTKGHWESSFGSFDECIAAHKRLSTLRPSHLTWAVSPPVGSYPLQPPSPFIIITQPESWYSFTVPCRVEGWVDLGTAGKMHTACAKGYKSQWLCDKHNCPQRDSIPGPRALQSDMLPLDHCDLWYLLWCSIAGCCSHICYMVNSWLHYYRYGYVTNTKIKFIIIVESSNTTLRDNEIRNVSICRIVDMLYSLVVVFECTMLNENQHLMHNILYIIKLLCGPPP